MIAVRGPMMRNRVFRFLAGALAMAIGWLLIVADGGRRPFREMFWFAVLGAAFGLFALFGSAPADRLISLMFGVNPPSDHRGDGGRH